MPVQAVNSNERSHPQADAHQAASDWQAQQQQAARQAAEEAARHAAEAAARQAADQAARTAGAKPDAKPASLLTDDPSKNPDNCLTQAAKQARPGDNIVFLGDRSAGSGGVGHVVDVDDRTGAVTDPEALDGSRGSASLPAYLDQSQAAGHDFKVQASVPAAEVQPVLALPADQRAAAIAGSHPDLAGVETQLYADGGTITRRNFGPVPDGDTADLQVTFNTPAATTVEIRDPSSGEWSLVGSTAGGTGISVPATARVSFSPLTTSPSLNYRVTDTASGAVQAGALSNLAAGQTTAQTVDLAGSTDASGTQVPNGSITLTATGTAPVGETGLTSTVQTEPAAPFTEAQLSSFTNQQSQDLFNLLGQQPKGSKGHTLYNLYQVIGLSQQSPFQTKVNLDKAQADASAILNDPANNAELGPLSTQASDQAAQAVFGTNGATAAARLDAYLTSPDVVSYAQGLDPTARQTFIDKNLGAEASFDTGAAQQTQQALVRQMLGGTPLQQIGRVSTEQAEKGVRSVLSLSLSQARFGLGVLNDTGFALSPENVTNISSFFSTQFRAGATQGQIGTAINGAAGLSAAEQTGARQIFSKLSSSGVFNAFQAAASAVAVGLDFSGNNSLPSGGPIGALTKAGDISLLLGTAGAGGGQALQALGLGPKNLTDLQVINRAFQGVSAATFRSLTRDAPDNATLAQRVIELQQTNPPPAPPDAPPDVLPTADELAAAFDSANAGVPAQAGNAAGSVASSDATSFHTALSNAVSDSSSDASFVTATSQLGAEFGEFDQLAAAAEQQAGPALQAAAATGDVPAQAGAIGEAISTAAGEAPDQAAGLGGLLGEAIADNPGAAAGAQALAAGGNLAQESVAWTAATGALKVIGVLGPVANGLYAAANAVSAVNNFKAGDVPTGTLNTLSAAAFTGAAVTGAIALTISSGPLAPIVGAALGLAGVAFSLASYFTQKSQAQKQENATIAFLQNGVGNGQSYLNT